MAKRNTAGTVQFTPVKTGDLKDIPPDLPPGAWEATCSVKRLKTSRDGFPMLCLEWKTTEALTGGNEDSVGAKASDFVTFWPQNKPASRMSKIRLKAMCTALGIDLPTSTKSLDRGSWDDLEEFIEELEGCKGSIWTILETRKDTGEVTTKILYTAPGSSTAMKAAKVSDDEEDEADEDDEEEDAVEEEEEADEEEEEEADEDEEEEEEPAPVKKSAAKKATPPAAPAKKAAAKKSSKK